VVLEEVEVKSGEEEEVRINGQEQHVFVKTGGSTHYYGHYIYDSNDYLFIGDCLVTESKAIHLWRNNVGKGLW
jgi:hypothetical protein